MQKLKLIYVFSPSFSGSTLLTLALNHHPDIASIGEVKATAMGDVSNYHCSCGVLLNDCDFWKGITEKINRLGYQFELDNFGTHYGSSNWLKNRILGAQVRGEYFEYLRGSEELVPQIDPDSCPLFSNQHPFVPRKLYYFLNHGDRFLR